MRGSFSPVIAPQLSAAQHRFLGLFLRELTEGGAALASAPAPPALVVRSFKLSPAEDRALTLAAARSGETVSDLLRRLIAAEI